MEVKINKEIREYTESIFFGLSLRQCIFSVLAIVIAVGIYFLIIDTLGLELTSWLCMLGAIPFAALGFIKYQGMNAEQIVKVAVRSFFLSNARLVFQPTNFYYESVKHLLDIKGGRKRDKKLREVKKTKQGENEDSQKRSRYRRSRGNL